MQIIVEGTVNGYVERKGKEQKVYRSVDLYVKGRDPGNLRVNIPDEMLSLVEVCRNSEGKAGRAVVELRKFEQTGKIFFDLVKLDVLAGTVAGKA